MRSRAWRAGAATALLFTTLPAANASADEYCQERTQPVASVLVIHGGAWMGGSAADGRDVCSPLAAMGYRVRSLEYPLWTVPGSIRYAHDAAREEAARGRPVYAVGISAGGTIAEYLALASDVDGAVAIAPLSDFVNWRPPTPGFWGKLGMTPAMRYRFSPYNNVRRPAPLRIIHSPQDHMVPYEQSVRMVGRCGQACELVTLRLGLGHISLGSRGPVLQWFARESLRPRFAARVAPAPVISRAALRPRRFRVGRTARRGTTLSYTLSEPAQVALTIERRLARSGWQRPAGSFTVQGTAGKNRTRFAGTIRGRALTAGSYRAKLVATSSHGRRSEPRRLAFRVRRP